MIFTIKEIIINIMSENNVIEITIKVLIIQLIEIIVKLIIKAIIVINEIM